MTMHCPDCLTQIAPRKASQDGRCDGCRAQCVQRRHKPKPKRVSNIEELDLRLVTQ